MAKSKSMDRLLAVKSSAESLISNSTSDEISVDDNVEVREEHGRLGRPRKINSDGKYIDRSKKLTVYLSESEMRAVELLARVRGVAKSELVLQTILNEISQPDVKEAIEMLSKIEAKQRM